MRNVKLLIEYEGTNYQGWQVQKIKNKKLKIKSRTIQEILENILSKILQEKVRIIGSGRTDAGVHAIWQTANFKTNSKMPVEKMQHALNGLLPSDIAVRRVEDVSLNFHSRFDVKSKTYRYIILQGPSRLVFNRQIFWYIPYKLDIAKMRLALRYLKGKHDFSAFCASASDVKDKIRTIKKITIKVEHKNIFALLSKGYLFLVIDIEADGFLYNMVRNIVGTLVEIGRGKLTPLNIKAILASKNRKNAGPTAPATGLTLFEIIY